MGTIREDYLKEIGMLPKLSYDESEALYTRYLNGEQELFEELLNGNLYRVYPTVIAMNVEEKIFMDAVQEGSYELLKVFTKTKPPVKNLITEMNIAIRRGITSVVTEEQEAKALVQKFTDDLKKVSDAATKFAKENGRAPKPKELAEALQMDEGDIRCMLDMAFPNDSTEADESKEKEEN